MSIDDFKLMRRKDLRGTQYVELAIDDTEYWSPRSNYLRDDIFAGLLNPDFKLANANFNFFGTAQFRTQDLEQLRTLLERNGSKLRAVNSYEEFIGYLNRENTVYNMEKSLRREFPDLEDIWPQLLAKFATINSEILEYVNAAYKSKKNLWVRGL